MEMKSRPPQDVFLISSTRKIRGALPPVADSLWKQLKDQAHGTQFYIISNMFM